MMSRRLAHIAGLLAVVMLCLPLNAAAVRATPQGAYTFTLTGSQTYGGRTEAYRDSGTLTICSTKLVGKNKSGEAKFNLIFTNPITDASSQTTKASGSLVIQDDVGTSKGTFAGTVRIQKTLAGTWKATINFTGTITSGKRKGATVSGKITAKSS